MAFWDSFNFGGPDVGSFQNTGLFDDSGWYPSMEDPMGTDTADWGSLLGGQGPSASGQQHLAYGRQAQAPQLNNATSVLNALMGQVGRAPQYQAGGRPYQNQYVTSLMNV